MFSNNEVITLCFKCLGAQGVTVKSFQNIVNPPLAVSSNRIVILCRKKGYPH